MDFVPCRLFGIHLPELLWYVPCTPHGSYGYCYNAILLYCYIAILLYCYIAILLYCYIAILLYCYIAIATPPPPSFPLSATLPSPPFPTLFCLSLLFKTSPNKSRTTPNAKKLNVYDTRHVQKKQAKKWTRRRKNDLLVVIYNTLTPLHNLFDWKPRPGIWSGTPSRQSSSFRSIPPIVFELLASGRSTMTMIGKCERTGPPAYVGCSSTCEGSAARAFEENVL